MTRVLKLGVLNIVASPHPEGIYRELLAVAASGEAQARGSDYARITRPRDEGDGILSGRILIYANIDKDSPWLDIETGEELTEEDLDEISIPDKARPNFKSFIYVFDEKNHLLYFETVNEFGKGLGISTAYRAIARLLGEDRTSQLETAVEVTVVPEEDAVDRILNMPGLKRLFIRINAPNPEDFEDKKLEVLRDLEANHAKRVDLNYVKAAGAESLTPTEEVRQLAQIGAENGYVKGESNGDGQPDELSTKALPKTIALPMEKDAGVLARMLGYVRNQGRRRQAQRP
ncbi:DUF4747 family protein [Bosea rubneri]|uniref:DUF4747 family protein n=1 Tax=Bosea rubneri TaxID=3075434 RepID=A0ABU3S444_9HYPH|nr:DUF4747 family protein [Bosea sp. ZW T0_25]MDU0339565.1 DUF4747 family protein [Bosea sp. ZW T0_25]